jgi:predicted amidophosphoribosyltransferase
MAPGSNDHDASGEAASGRMPRLSQSACVPAHLARDDGAVLAARVLALVVPPCCAVCRAPGLRAGDVLCAACRRGLPWLRGPLCPQCALPVPCAAGGRACPAAQAAFGSAWAPVAYAGVARDAVRALKFAGARPLARTMAA